MYNIQCFDSKLFWMSCMSNINIKQRCTRAILQELKPATNLQKMLTNGGKDWLCQGDGSDFSLWRSFGVGWLVGRLAKLSHNR